MRTALHRGGVLLFFLALAPLPLRADDATAPGPLDPLLANVRLPLSAAQREAVARDAMARNRWAGLSRLLGGALLTDTKSGYVDQLPWISRLRLAQAFVWLGTPEREFAPAQLALQADLPGVGKKDRPDPAWLDAPDGADKLAPVFGDAANFPRAAIVAARIKPDTLAALLANEALINLLGETATRDDYQPGVWRVLADLQEHRPGGMTDAPALAVALAVVYDRAFPPDWPHHQVARRQVPFVWNNWNALFDYFLDARRDGTLLADPEALDPAQLRFLVDLPLPLSELTWAQQNVHADRSGFEKVFPTISYDTARLRDGEFHWMLKDYRLERIAAAGGICVDQAYFSAMAGKALGLPTLFFTGQGSFGGHAWFGYLRDDNVWFLDAGRYANQNYVTGSARDPQSWREINDHQLAFLSDTGNSQTVYHYSRNLLALALLPGVREDPAQRQRLLAAALECDPKLPEIWEAVADTLREVGPPEALQKHYQAMAEQFAQQDDLRVEALRSLAELDDATGDPDAAAELRKQIYAARSDLAIAAAREAVEAEIKAGRYDAARAQLDGFVAFFFARAKHEKLSAGDLFYDLVAPSVLALARAQQDEAAGQALAAAAPHFDLDQPGSILARDFHLIEGALAAQRKKRAPASDLTAPTE